MPWPISTGLAQRVKYDLQQYGNTNVETHELRLMPELDDYLRALRVAESLKEVALSRLDDVINNEVD